jgi:hypothetical protein
MGFALKADDSCLAIWQRGTHASIVRNIILPRAQVLAAPLLSLGDFMIALEVPIRLQRSLGPTLAH